MDRNSPQKYVWRAQIVLLTAEGRGTMELIRRTGKSKTSVWRWQERFVAEGIPGLLRDKTRPARIPLLGAEVEARVVAATQTTAPGETTHWTSVAMARHIGISVSSVQRIWRKHGLQPHKLRQFKLSNDPRFAAKRVFCRDNRSSEGPVRLSRSVPKAAISRPGYRVVATATLACTAKRVRAAAFGMPMASGCQVSAKANRAHSARL
jgi:transposase